MLTRDPPPITERSNVRPILGPIPVYDSDYGHQVKAGGEAKKGVHKLNLWVMKNLKKIFRQNEEELK